MAGFNSDNNPIAGVGTSSSVLSAVYPPSSYEVEHEDLSDKDAGRTEDGVMHKNRIGTITGVKLSWKGLNSAKAGTLFSLFKPEYVWVRFFDPFLNDYETRLFYTGNKKSTLYNAELDLWEKITFNLIERSPVDYI